MALQGLIVCDVILADTRDGRAGVSASAMELLHACQGRGLRLGLAVDAGPARRVRFEPAAAREVQRLFDTITLGGSIVGGSIVGGSIATALIKNAADELGLHPAECALLGDTPQDAEAAKHAGVVVIDLLSGGHPAGALHRAGARLVYDDAADLLHHLDDALRKASPARLRLKSATLEKIMDHALAAAERAMQQGDVPIGAALLDGDGRLVASAHNEMASSGNKTAHAEIVTFARAAGRIPLDARDSILVSTLEPCVMCTGAAMEAAVDTIVYGLRAPADSGTGRVNPPSSPESQMPRIVGDIRGDESRALLQRWLDDNQDNPQAAFVRQLLRLTGER